MPAVTPSSQDQAASTAPWDGAGLSRRRWWAWCAGWSGLAATGPARAQPAPDDARLREGPLHRRPLPRQAGHLPVIGLGSWITFNVGRDAAALGNSTAVIAAFVAAGGRLIDSSPMYGSSQATIGQALASLGREAASPVFSADKVWTGETRQGPAQVAESLRHWGLPRFDLLQVHNLLAWQDHLPRLLAWRDQGQLGFVGITTSHGRRHAELAQIMRSQPIDFVQLTYNLQDREAERELLPLAQERGIAVIVNRPLRGGQLPQALAGQRLPGWASDIGCDHWAQVALKFCAAHPAVTCVIPATRQVAHLQQNMAAGTGALPDAALRRRMAADVARLV